MQSVLTAGTVITRPDVVLADAAVVVDDEVISWVGPRAEAPSTPGAPTLDFGSDTLLPGMFDMHVHLGFDGGPDPVRRMRESTDPQLLVLMLHSARQLLRAGVTTARDLGARGALDSAVKEAVASGLAAGPRLLTAGAPLTTTGGHCWFMGAECDGAGDLRRRIREQHKAGADVVKIMATGGMMTPRSVPWTAQFDVDEMRAATDEAHRLGKRITAHAHGLPGIRNALAARVDGLEHCSWATASGRELDLALVDQMVAQGTSVCSTTHVGWQRAPDRAQRLSNLRTMYERGVRLVAGTDAGINRVPHDAYAEGLLVLAEAGLSPADVLHAATLGAAEACDLASTSGSLEVGKRADLIAVPRNPLADLSALREVHWVMTAGRPYRTAEVLPF